MYLYHGSYEPLTEFNISKNIRCRDSEGLYCTKNLRTASNYGSAVYKVHLKPNTQMLILDTKKSVEAYVQEVFSHLGKSFINDFYRDCTMDDIVGYAYRFGTNGNTTWRHNVFANIQLLVDNVESLSHYCEVVWDAKEFFDKKYPVGKVMDDGLVEYVIVSSSCIEKIERR